MLISILLLSGVFMKWYVLVLMVWRNLVVGDFDGVNFDMSWMGWVRLSVLK